MRKKSSPVNTTELTPSSGSDTISVGERVRLRGRHFHSTKFNRFSDFCGHLLLLPTAVMMNDDPDSTAQIRHRQQSEVKEVDKKLKDKFYRKLTNLVNLLHALQVSQFFLNSCRLSPELQNTSPLHV